MNISALVTEVQGFQFRLLIVWKPL